VAHRSLEQSPPLKDEQCRSRPWHEGKGRRYLRRRVRGGRDWGVFGVISSSRELGGRVTLNCHSKTNATTKVLGWGTVLASQVGALSRKPFSPNSGSDTPRTKTTHIGALELFARRHRRRSKWRGFNTCSGGSLAALSVHLSIAFYIKRQLDLGWVFSTRS
jgi:hypothetical protein